MNTRRAGCGESRTSGSEGGPEKPTHRKVGRALRSDPYIIGARNGSAVLTMIERVSRYALLTDLPEGYGSEAVAGAFVEAFESIPASLRRSLTLDQGSEWAAWPSLAATYGLDVWFCDPHSPWQRGAIENLNGHVRFWLPRGRRLDIVSPGELASVAGLLNNQRRRILGWESPAARYEALAG